jgi:hypothetical protein
MDNIFIDLDELQRIEYINSEPYSGWISASVLKEKRTDYEIVCDRIETGYKKVISKIKFKIPLLSAFDIRAVLLYTKSKNYNAEIKVFKDCAVMYIEYPVVVIETKKDDYISYTI